MVLESNQHCTKEIWKKLYNFNAFDQKVSLYRNQKNYTSNGAFWTA